MFQKNAIVTAKRVLSDPNDPQGPCIPQDTTGTIVALRVNGAWVEFSNHDTAIFVLYGNIQSTGTLDDAYTLTPESTLYAAEIARAAGLTEPPF